MISAAHLLFVCLVGIATGAAGVPAASVTQVLPAFTGIKDSLPFAGRIVTGPNDTTYDLTLLGPPAVLALINATVKQNTTLDLKAKTKGPVVVNATEVSYVVRLPAGYLASYKQSGSGSTIVDGAVANTTNFVVSVTGAATASVANVTSKLVNATLTGVGSLEVNATTKGKGIDELVFSSVGAGTGHVNGVSKVVEVDIAGISNVYVAGGSDSLVITGTAVGMSTVYFEKGICNVTSPNPFRSTVCVQQPAPATLVA